MYVFIVRWWSVWFVIGCYLMGFCYEIEVVILRIGVIVWKGYWWLLGWLGVIVM